MPTGTVKWFNAAKGYGFIQPEGGGPDAFVHISAVEAAGLSTLNEGQRVQYQLVQGQRGKSSAQKPEARLLSRSGSLTEKPHGESQGAFLMTCCH